MFSQNGRAFATLRSYTDPDDELPVEEKIIVLDIATGKTLWTFEEDGTSVWHLSLSPDGTLLATCRWSRDPNSNEDIQVRVWDLASGKQIVSFPAQGIPEFLAEGKCLVMCDDYCVRFCDAMTGKEFAVAPIPASVLPGGSMLLIDFHLLTPVPGSHLLAVRSGGHSKPSPFFQWCSSNLGMKKLGEEIRSDEVAFLDTRTGEKVAGVVRKRIGERQISPDGKTLALTTSENDESIIEIWDIPPRKPLRWVLGLLAIPSVVTLITLKRWWKSRL
jgi:WD40 repeat protein